MDEFEKNLTALLPSDWRVISFKVANSPRNKHFGQYGDNEELRLNIDYMTPRYRVGASYDFLRRDWAQDNETVLSYVAGRMLEREGVNDE